MWARGEIYSFNGSKHVVEVRVDGNSLQPIAVDIGCWGVHENDEIIIETSMVTLSYYTDTRDLKSIFLLDNGSWTSSITSMVHQAAQKGGFSMLLDASYLSLD